MSGTDPSDDSGDDSFDAASEDSSTDVLGTLRDWFEEASTSEDGPDLDELSDRERGALKRARAMGTALDEAIPIPGIGYRVGIDPIVGLLPVSGDAVGAALSSHIIIEAARVGVPRETLAKMALYVAIDAVVGSIPVAGDIFDAVWKANERNVALFEAHFENRTDAPAE
jgi:hypothetical protein